ncbi:acyl-CoA dehydrogenase family protein [Streptomyces sp. NPDC056452]|uniref:acyl-CoA dehydrogenase family protein n=1 Tax=Streptomyces sp. NPDC056452 TaxID=3345821 RepID=UPI00367B4536
MRELDAERRAVRDMCREAAAELRTRGAAVDANPLELADHLDVPVLRMARLASTPKAYRGSSTAAGVTPSEGCLSRAVASLELSRGDAGLVVGNTGPALAGLVVEALGSDAQREVFYRALEDGRTWSFCAVSEPRHGSDATALETGLLPDPDGGGHRLHGSKRYITNGSRGAVGVVLARTGPSPLSIRAVLVRCPAPGFTARPLDMVGLRAAEFSELSLDGMRVAPEMLLGGHLRASRRGVWGLSRAFNQTRLQVAAMALGVAFAAYDYAREHRPGHEGHELLGERLDAARSLLYDAAAEADHAPDALRAPSMAKLHATDLAVRTVRRVADVLGPGSLLTHPLLEKWSRDVCAFEFMDGTSNILRLHIAATAAPAGV